VLGATVSGVHGEPPPWKVTFHIYLDAEAMALRIKLHFGNKYYYLSKNYAHF
jgi:hypothetical protein